MFKYPFNKSSVITEEKIKMLEKRRMAKTDVGSARWTSNFTYFLELTNPKRHVLQSGKQMILYCP